jgi:hypothetical protein
MVVFERESIWQVLYSRPLATIIIIVVVITFVGSLMPKKKKPKRNPL